MIVAWVVALTATAASAAVTVLPEELTQKTAWVQRNLLSATTVPPFSFTYGGQSSSTILPSWARTVATTVLDANRTRYTMIWTNAGNALQVRCVAVEYGDYYSLTPYSLTNTAWIAWQFDILRTCTRTPWATCGRNSSE